MKHVPALDGVRGIAIIAVLLVHTTIAFDNLGISGISKVLDAGAYGVDLFFALSGFLITGILLDTKNSPHYFSSFYARRALRLFPAYFLYLLAVAQIVPAIHASVHTSMPDYRGPWWWYITYLSNWKLGGGAGDSFLGHFWSLAVEEQFYLFWSIIVWLIPSRRSLGWLCIVLAVTALALRIAFYGADWNVIYRLTPMRSDALGLGSLMAIVYRSKTAASNAIKRLSPRISVVGYTAFAVVALISGGAEWSRPLIGTIGGTLLAIGSAALVLYTATVQPTWLTVPALTVSGKYSYGIYVWHILAVQHVFWIIAYFAQQHHELWWIAQPLAIAASYIVALISFWLIEERALRLKRLFPYGIPTT